MRKEVPRMNDIEYIYRQDIREKKAAGHGVYGKRGGARSRYVGLPHDHMTEAQLRRRNGPVQTYNINTCINSYADFKRLPDDLKKTYLANVFSTYTPSIRLLGETLHVSDECIRSHIRRLNLPFATKRGGRKKVHPLWPDFIAGRRTTCGALIPGAEPVEAEEIKIFPPVEAKTEVVETVETEVSPAILYRVTVHMEGTTGQLSDMLAMLTDPTHRYEFELCVKEKGGGQ